MVTEPIPLRDHPEVVVEFFVHYGSMTVAERGYDPTVILATVGERRTFKSRLSEYKKRVDDEELRLHPDVEKLDLDNVVKIQVNNEEDGNTSWYLACRP